MAEKLPNHNREAAKRALRRAMVGLPAYILLLAVLMFLRAGIAWTPGWVLLCDDQAFELIANSNHGNPLAK